MTLLHDNALLFADCRSRHGCQHAAAADCRHSSCRSADRQHADHRPAAHSPMCVDRRTQTFRTRKPLVVSLPRTTPDVALNDLSESLPQRDYLQTVNVLLGKLMRE